MMYLPFLLCRGYVAAKAAAKEEDALPPSFGPFQISCVLPSPKLTAMAASMRSISSPSTRPMRSRRRRLSSVRTYSSRTTLSRGRPWSGAESAICVGSFALFVWDVIAAAITVGL